MKISLSRGPDLDVVRKEAFLIAVTGCTDGKMIDLLLERDKTDTASVRNFGNMPAYLQFPVGCF